MDDNGYRKLWYKLEREAREHHGVEGFVSVDRDALNRSTRQAFSAYIAELYAEHWRLSYALVGLAITETREVLAARAMEVHHWTPDVAAAASTDDLVKALAKDISHCSYPQQALQFLEMMLSDLPERHDVIAHWHAQADHQQNPA